MTKNQELTALLEEGRTFTSFDFFNHSSWEKIKLEMWFNNVNLFAKNRLTNNELKEEIINTCFCKDTVGLKDTYEHLSALLFSLVNFLYPEHEVKNATPTKPLNRNFPMKYDVFISHANRDKISYVDDLFKVIKDLGVNVFYDTDTFSWGDNWKSLIYEGTAQSEFAIIVISENFFGREWTEIELKEFLERQNTSGQKIILPLLYNITIDDLYDKYPSLCDIQCLRADEWSIDKICILFAKELIKRLKGIQ